jgi:hypothetical protein
LGERDCGARGKKKCYGNGKHLVHKARLLAKRRFSELNVVRAAAFRLPTATGHDAFEVENFPIYALDLSRVDDRPSKTRYS